MIEKLKTVNTVAKEIFKEAMFNFMVDIETLVHKTSVDPKLLLLKVCLRNNENERAPEDIFPVITGLTERFGLLLAGNKIIIPEELEEEVVDALHFGHPESTKMLAESNIFCWRVMQKDTEEKCST